jgi:hypothetical protein
VAEQEVCAVSWGVQWGAKVAMEVTWMSSEAILKD